MDRLFPGEEISGLPAVQKGPTADQRRIPVFIDSPLGLEVTKIHFRLTAFWGRGAAGPGLPQGALAADRD
jgi:hypothetical protein